MSNYAIEIKGLWKQYRLGEQQPYVALRDILSNPLSAFSSKPKEEFWALKDINLKVKDGEVLGVIGKNGSGKSTLLKILTRITPPTKGLVKLNGRVASLLEVGTGFNPELTGRENIYLNGSILGMTRTEIKRKFDEIVDFSGVEKFIDTPVKRYSSGMYVRLAFAVAAHLESEILLVDEVLAVGDMEFQKKCLGKMKDVTRSGKTVLFVSHNMPSVQSLCDKCLWLDSGQTTMHDLSSKVVSRYSLNAESYSATKSFLKAPNDHKAFIQSVECMNHKGVTVKSVPVGKKFFIKVIYRVLQKIDKCTFDLVISKDNFPLVSTSESDSSQVLYSREKGIYTCTVEFDNNIFNPGRYLMEIALKYPGVEFYSRRQDLLLDITAKKDMHLFNDIGPINPRPTFITTHLP